MNIYINDSPCIALALWTTPNLVQCLSSTCVNILVRPLDPLRMLSLSHSGDDTKR